jgi:beta-galactosidase
MRDSLHLFHRLPLKKNYKCKEAKLMSKNISRRRFLNFFTLADAIVGDKVEEPTSYAVAPEPEATMYNPPASNRVDTPINTGWKFNQGDVSDAQISAFNDSDWSAVTLPHTWNNIDGEHEETYYRGVSWYRLHYTVPATYEGQRLYLQFDGASLVADVYVNDTYLGGHQGGYSAFRFDATSALTVGGDNVIAVKVNNSYATDISPLNGDFTVFGGLYRAVHLLAVDEVHINLMDYGSSGLFLRQSQVGATSADLQVTVEARNDSASAQSVILNTFVVDARNTIVQTLSSPEIIAAHSGHTFVQTMIIGQPHLWDGQRDPYLYHVYAQVQVGSSFKDVVSAPLGFRSYAIDPDNGFFLNGRYLDLHGVNVHQDRLDQGWAVSDAELDEDFNLIVAMGANAIRTSHYQHAQRLYDNADAYGIIIWSEQPIINSILATSAFAQNAEQQLTEMIRQNYNHPSIIFWGIANEVGNDATTNTLLQTLNNAAHTHDPDRITTLASDHEPSDAISTHTNTVGYNRYYGWYAGNFDDLGTFLTNTHESFPTKGFALSEYGAGASIHQHEEDPTRPVTTSKFHPEEWQALLHEAYWQALQQRPYVWGKFVWSMFDFASAGRDEGDQKGRNDKGLCTYDRKTCKDAYYWYKVNWTTAPFVYITNRRFATRTAATTDIKVYANTDVVTLTLNGVSLETKTSTNHIFLWSSVTLQAGNNTVKAVGTQDTDISTDTVMWNLQ